MTETTDLLDSRTDPVLVWDQLKNLTPEELIQWRVAPLNKGLSATKRNIDLPIPYGWFAICYSDELQAGQVKPLNYFDQELVVWRGDDGNARVLDAYCPHLGAHMGYGGKVDGNHLQCPFHAWRWNGEGAAVAIPYSKSKFILRGDAKILTNTLFASKQRTKESSSSTS